MLRRRTAGFVCACLTAVACGRAAKPPAAKVESPDNRVRALADAYLSAYFDRFPEVATSFGVPGRHHNTLTDNSLTAQRAWEAREDAWLADLKQIDRGSVVSQPLRATYAITRQAIEGSIAKRVCRDELWNVSEMTGWQVNYGYLVTIQPVGSDAARAEAVERWRRLPAWIDTEIVNLREGIRLGYTAPRQNVRTVIEQVRTLAASTSDDSPFASPGQRDKTAEFQKTFAALLADEINPAARRYADFL